MNPYFEHANTHRKVLGLLLLSLTAYSSAILAQEDPGEMNPIAARTAEQRAALEAKQQKAPESELQRRHREAAKAAGPIDKNSSWIRQGPQSQGNGAQEISPLFQRGVDFDEANFENPVYRAANGNPVPAVQLSAESIAAQEEKARLEALRKVSPYLGDPGIENLLIDLRAAYIDQLVDLELGLSRLTNGESATKVLGKRHLGNYTEDDPRAIVRDKMLMVQSELDALVYGGNPRSREEKLQEIQTQLFRLNGRETDMGRIRGMKAFLENTTKTYAPEIPKGERPNATLLRRTAEAPTPTLLIQSLLLEERIKNLETTRKRRRSELKNLQPTQMDKVLKDLYEYNQEQLAHYNNEIRKRGPAAQKLKRQM